jgi:ABC-type glycerol-3-phosphate transport system substrate-binding protein
MLQRVYRSLLLLLCCITLIATMPPAAYSQNQPVIIRLNVPVQQYEALMFSDVIADFEDEHEGIRVQVSRGDAIQPFFVQSEDAAAQLATTADVVYVESTMMTPNISPAGLFLDMRPLVSVDETLNPDDFYPAAWQSFQWQNGIWAMPMTLHPILLSYAPDAFDNANLAYPDATWTTRDLITAMQALAQRDTEGNIIQGSLGLSHPDDRFWLLRSLMNTGVLDNASRPQLTTPPATDLLQTWNSADAEQFISDNAEALPLMIDPYMPELRIPSGRELALLPGGQAGIRINGLAISNGTRYPEAAYQLVMYLSRQSQTLSLTGFSLPARYSVQSDDNWNALLPEHEVIVRQALPLMLPFSELRYVNYLQFAIDQMQQGTSAQDALRIAEERLITAQQDAADSSDRPPVSVDPVPEQDRSTADGVQLRFGFHSYVAMLENTNQMLWDSVMDDFIASDPHVTAVQMESIVNPVNFADSFDCFFTPRGISNLQPEALLDMTPLILADANATRDDFVPGALEQVTHNEGLYGYPMLIQFELLTYNPTAFEQAGLTLPETTWTVSQFTEALIALHDRSGDSAAFGTTRQTSTDLLQLIAAYGGLPIDYRSTPPQPAFTAPQNIAAIRQALDLARDGVIQYVPRPSASATMPDITESKAPVMPETAGFVLPQNSPSQHTGKTLYPAGATYVPVSTGVGALYISATTPHPEACYRWIQTVASTPGLIQPGMPARQSMLDDPAFQAAHSAEDMLLYEAVLTRLQSPNAVSIPSPWVGNTSLAAYWLEDWLYEAFSAYVLEDTSLELALTGAQEKADAYVDCLSRLPDNETQLSDTNTRFELYRSCAASADPAIDDS